MAPSPKTIVYKTAGKLEIPLDIYLPPKAQNVPIICWFHGGGLLMGRRGRVAPHMLRSVEKYNHALISADYSLAPQAGIEAIYEDVRDCINFIRSPEGLAKHVEQGALDASRLAVSGSSAGGYLALLAGLYAEPKPEAVLAIYPITDPLGTFFTNSQPFPAGGGKTDLSKKVSKEVLEPFLDPAGEKVANNDDTSDRGQFYFYMMEKANLSALLQFNTPTGPESYRDPANDKFRIARSLAECGLPPTYVVHGDADRAVGVEQSDEVVGAMMGEGMEVKYRRLRGKDHLFDVEESVELEEMYQFMHEHLDKSASKI